MRYVLRPFTGRRGAAVLMPFLLYGLCTAAGAYTVNHTRVDLDHPPGRLLDIGGYRLHIYCLGRGSPTVVLDSGIGGFSLEWLDIQTALSRHTRVCTYDRAGYGWSDRSPYPRTTRVIVQELHRLLSAAHETPPYVLAGHSFGGYNIRYFAGEFPREVAGLVLIDASHPRQFSRFPPPPPGTLLKPPPDTGTRIVRPEFPSAYPKAIRQLAFLLMVHRRSARIQLQEVEHFEESAREVLAQHERFPNLPVIVITRGRRVWPHNGYGDAMEQAWTDLQHNLLSLSQRSVQIVAMNSGHAIHLEQPQVVIAGILRDLRSARWDAARPNLVTGFMPDGGHRLAPAATGDGDKKPL